jgi:uncharacterized protein
VLCLQIDEIEETPREFRLEADPGWWDETRQVFREPEIEMATPFVVTLRAHRVGMRLLCQGQIRGVVDLPCGRCVEPYGYEFREPLQLLLEPVLPGQEEPEGGLELDPEDLELGRYSGDVLDFGTVVREILALAWPVQPRCSEECRGLCPVCGCNRNEETCSCSDEASSRPFSDLDERLREAADRKRG